MMTNESRQPRRRILASAGLGLLATALAACTTYGKKPAATPDGAAPVDSATPGAPASGAPTDALAKTADVPVGSGLIVDDVVVTQPTAGVFSGFSAVCTHAGCTVSEVTDGGIVCPCHGSTFNLDGTVAQGPATKPLEARSITVQGDSIIAG